MPHPTTPSLFSPGYYTSEELRAAGFGSVGDEVYIAKNCTIIGFPNIHLGDNVRIDGYCTLIAPGDGYIRLGSHIHIGSYCLLSGGSGIVMGDFAGLSQRVSLYSRSDDYSGAVLTNPTVDAAFTGAVGGEIRLERHTIIGSGSVVLPGVALGEGVAVGALALVTRSLDAWGIYGGTPARRLKARSRELLNLEQRFLADR